MAASDPSAVTITKDNIKQFNHYELFHLDPNVAVLNESAIRRAYRRYSLLFHPDKDQSPEAREAFEMVKLAVDTLLDAEKRTAYDRSLADQARGGSSSEGAAQRQQQQQAEDDAKFAEMILKQREDERAAMVAQRRAAEAERSAAARRMQDELTSSLETPFGQMEKEMVRDWDVDDELLKLKLAEVQTLLATLAKHAGPSDGNESEDIVQKLWKRSLEMSGPLDAKKKRI